MEKQRAEEIGVNLRAIVVNLNAITEEELHDLYSDADHDMALGPMMDPSAFQDGKRFDQIHKTQKVLRALLDFKKEVKGIGYFS